MEEEWPENPSAAWLGAWAAKQKDIPFILNVEIMREIYNQKRAEALKEN